MILEKNVVETGLLLSIIPSLGFRSPNIEHGHYEGSLNRSEWDPVTGRTIGVQKAKYYEGADEEEGIFHDLTAVGQSNTIQACGKLSKK